MFWKKNKPPEAEIHIRVVDGEIKTKCEWSDHQSFTDLLFAIYSGLLDENMLTAAVGFAKQNSKEIEFADIVANIKHRDDEQQGIVEEFEAIIKDQPIVSPRQVFGRNMNDPQNEGG